MKKFRKNLLETLKFTPEKDKGNLTRAFDYGIELTTKYYEDKLRWISVEERIPTKKINSFVLFKNGHSSYCFKPSSLEMGMKEWIILNGITEWRSFL